MNYQEMDCKRIKESVKGCPRHNLDGAIEYLKERSQSEEEYNASLSIIGRVLYTEESKFLYKDGDLEELYNRSSEMRGTKRKEYIASLLTRAYFSPQYRGLIRFALLLVLTRIEKLKVDTYKESDGELVDLVFSRSLKNGEVYWREGDTILTEESVAGLRRMDMVFRNAMHRDYLYLNRY